VGAWDWVLGLVAFWLPHRHGVRSRAATITRFFSPLSKEEVHEKIKKDLAAWQEEERNRVAWNEAAKAAKESARLAAKRPVGRPKKVRA